MKMRFDKKTIIYLVLLILLGLLGYVFYSTFDDGVKFVGITEVYEMQMEIDREKAEIEQFGQLISEKEVQIGHYSGRDNDEGDIEEALRIEYNELKKVAGFTPVTGEGVIIIITDADRALLNNEDPNNVIVHDADIVNIINELREAGAEAISVNGQRIIWNQTDVVCNGPTIRINDELYAQPYIIKAIGDRYHLEAAINAPGQYGYTLQQYGIFVEVNTSVSVDIPAYTGPATKAYAKELEGGV